MSQWEEITDINQLAKYAGKIIETKPDFGICLVLSGPEHYRDGVEFVVPTVLAIRDGVHSTWSLKSWELNRFNQIRELPIAEAQQVQLSYKYRNPALYPYLKCNKCGEISHRFGMHFEDPIPHSIPNGNKTLSGSNHDRCGEFIPVHHTEVLKG